MHINHLIWDRIFADPEIGNLVRFKYDQYGCSFSNIQKYETGRLPIHEYNRLYILKLYRLTHEYRHSDGLTIRNEPYRHGCIRGIHVHLPDKLPLVQHVFPLPTLKVSTILVLVNTMMDQLNIAIKELEKKMDDGIVIPSFQGKLEAYMKRKYLTSISKDVLDSVNLYRIDIYRLTKYYSDKSSPLYSDHFENVNTKFKYIFYRLILVDMDILKSWSIYIERVWNLVIKIFRFHHELIYIITQIHTKPIRPGYYYMFDLLRKRIHLQNRYQ